MGGGGDAVVTTPDTPPVATASARDKFLLFPNPQQTPDPPGTLPRPHIDSVAYAQAYYAAIDPNNEKDTLAKWKAANGFGTNAGTEVTVAFGDTRDLGYGRRMTGRISIDKKTIAFIVENYQVDPGGAYGYSPLSLDAAVREDMRWRILINAIEWSPGPRRRELREILQLRCPYRRAGADGRSRRPRSQGHAGTVLRLPWRSRRRAGSRRRARPVSRSCKTPLRTRRATLRRAWRPSKSITSISRRYPDSRAPSSSRGSRR